MLRFQFSLFQAQMVNLRTTFISIHTYTTENRIIFVHVSWHPMMGVRAILSPQNLKTSLNTFTQILSPKSLKLTVYQYKSHQAMGYCHYVCKYHFLLQMSFKILRNFICSFSKPERVNTYNCWLYFICSLPFSFWI